MARTQSHADTRDKNGATPATMIKDGEALELRERYVMPLPGPMYSTPLELARGQGQFVYDKDGAKYLDAFAGVATISIGHCHPYFVEKIHDQMKELFHTSPIYVHPQLGRYAMRLIERVRAANPELEMCFFTNSGAEANELAAMLAKNYTGSHEFVALRHAYHGRTMMAAALTGQAAWRHSMPYPSGVVHAMANYAYRRPRGMTAQDFTAFCVQDFKNQIETSTSGRIAAFYAEPINGVGGVITPEPAYFPAVYEIVKKAGGLWVSDEVQTGVYRTGGSFLGIEKWGVKPDIVTMAKGLGNGYPIGAVVTTRNIADAMKGKPHFNTFGGSPVQMAAANAVLDVLEMEKIPDNVTVVGAKLLKGLKEIESRSRWAGEARGKGLMLGLELVKDKETKEPATQEAVRVLDLMKDRKVLIGRGGICGNVLRIKPPLCFTAKDVDVLLSALEDSLKSL